MLISRWLLLLLLLLLAKVRKNAFDCGKTCTSMIVAATAFVTGGQCNASAKGAEFKPVPL